MLGVRLAAEMALQSVFPRMVRIHEHITRFAGSADGARFDEGDDEIDSGGEKVPARISWVGRAVTIRFEALVGSEFTVILAQLQHFLGIASAGSAQTKARAFMQAMRSSDPKRGRSRHSSRPQQDGKASAGQGIPGFGFGDRKAAREKTLLMALCKLLSFFYPYFD